MLTQNESINILHNDNTNIQSCTIKRDWWSHFIWWSASLWDFFFDNMDEEATSNFIYDKNTGRTTCNRCSISFNGYNKWNLKRHFENCVLKHNNQNKDQDVGLSLARKIHCTKITISTRQIIESIVKVVTIRGKPLVDVNKNFQELLSPVILKYFGHLAHKINKTFFL